MSAKPTICLNMIVKNESHVITRCLESVKDVINYWVISDTGSTDGTQDIITNYFDQHRIPGILTEDPWKNFAHNRNLALAHAQGKGDYILFMDADDYLDKKPGFRFGNLTADNYLLKIHYANHDYANTKLIRSALPWKWQGVLHEYLQCAVPTRSETLPGDYCIRASTEGARNSNPNKYLDDAKVLEKALIDEPLNTRYRFYLAQSYRDAGKFAESLNNYQKRVDMGGWEEEVFYSLLEIAKNKQRLNHSGTETLEAFLKAHHYRPQRLEAIYEVVKKCRINGNYHLGYQLGQDARYTPTPNDILFLDKPIYDWCFRDELSICAVYANQPQEAAKMMETLLRSPLTPDGQKPRLEANLTFAKSLM